MADVFDLIGQSIDEFADGKHQVCDYYLFEPWDVEKRPQWVIDQAAEDGIDLYNNDLIRNVGMDPHPFQTGYMLSDAFFRSLIAGSQTGKSYAGLIDGFAMITGEIPISMRYPAGHDTKVKRLITPENIARFGRFDSRSGKFLDKDASVRLPEGWEEWNCGNVIGVGIYPPTKIAPPGSELWIGTLMRASVEFWWPRLHDAGKILIPPHLIDRKRGNDGYNIKDGTVYLIRDAKASVITYESGFQRFEAEKVWACLSDEEPKDQRIIQSMQQHCNFLSLLFTPYYGITYTRDLVFPKKISPQKKTFHASQYDSPYQDKKTIAVRRENMPNYEIGARIWGVHTDTSGKPYYDRMKITQWLQRFNYKKNYVTFVPEDEYFGITNSEYVVRDNDEKILRPLMDVPVTCKKADEDNRVNTWIQYEDVIEGMPYVFVADPAEGAETPEAVGDMNAALIIRPPRENEKKPKIALAIRSTAEVVIFARDCSHAIRYYNNALLAAETKRGSANATFASELRDWPFWFKMVSIQDSTNKPRKQNGFDTNAATRGSLFDYIGSWLDEYKGNEYPDIPDEDLLHELSAAVQSVKSGKARCDHPYDGSLDTAICFGIFLYIWKHSREQIVYNGPKRIVRKDKRHPPKNGEMHGLLGLGMMGYRGVQDEQQKQGRIGRSRR